MAAFLKHNNNKSLKALPSSGWNTSRSRDEAFPVPTAKLSKVHKRDTGHTSCQRREARISLPLDNYYYTPPRDRSKEECAA